MINHFVIYLVSSIIRCLEFLFFARAIMSWFSQGSKIQEFLYLITEPVIMPFRALFNRLQILRGFPLDIPFFAAFLMLEVIQVLLYSL